MSASNPLLRRRHRRLLVEFATSGAPLVTDSFTRADNAVSLGSTEGGSLGPKVWTAHGGTWGVIAGTAYAPGGGGTYHAASVDAGVSNALVQAVFATLGGSIGLSARITDDSNFLHLEYGGGSDLTLYKRVAGAFTQIGTAVVTQAAGDLVALECRGNTLNAYQNGVLKFTVTDAFNNTATRFGLSTNSTLVRYDAFAIAP